MPNNETGSPNRQRMEQTHRNRGETTGSPRSRDFASEGERPPDAGPRSRRDGGTGEGSPIANAVTRTFRDLGLVTRGEDLSDNPGLSDGHSDISDDEAIETLPKVFVTGARSLKEMGEEIQRNLRELTSDAQLLSIIKDYKLSRDVRRGLISDREFHMRLNFERDSNPQARQISQDLQSALRLENENKLSIHQAQKKIAEDAVEEGIPKLKERAQDIQAQLTTQLSEQTSDTQLSSLIENHKSLEVVFLAVEKFPPQDGQFSQDLQGVKDLHKSNGELVDSVQEKIVRDTIKESALKLTKRAQNIQTKLDTRTSDAQLPSIVLEYRSYKFDFEALGLAFISESKSNQDFQDLQSLHQKTEQSILQAVASDAMKEGAPNPKERAQDIQSRLRERTNDVQLLSIIQDHELLEVVLDAMEKNHSGWDLQEAKDLHGSNGESILDAQAKIADDAMEEGAPKLKERAEDIQSRLRERTSEDQLVSITQDFNSFKVVFNSLDRLLPQGDYISRRAFGIYKGQESLLEFRQDFREVERIHAMNEQSILQAQKGSAEEEGAK